MDEITKTKIEADQAKVDAKQNGLMVRLIGYLLALVIGGAIVCFVIGLLKTTVDILIIVGAILLVVAILLVWMYHSLKWHIKDRRYRRLLGHYQQAEQEDESKAANGGSGDRVP